jgi:hypothetical protein
MTLANYQPDPLRVLLARLGRVRQTPNGWEARCPAHEDKKPSLSVALSQDGETILLKCHAGCDTSAVLKAVGLQLRDLFRASWLAPSRPAKDAVATDGPLGKRHITAVYDYTDLAGKVLFQVVRFEPKDFRQRRPDGNGGWIWNLDGVKERPLYRLRDVIAAKPQETIFVVEGENDADRLAREGLVATTNPGGAGKWLAEHSSLLVGRRVCVIGDNDDIGRSHQAKAARAVAEANSLAKAEGQVRMWPPPGVPDKGDISDWFNQGGTAHQLLNEIQKATPIGVDTGEGCPPLERTLPGEKPGPLLTTLADVPPREVTWLWPGRLARGKLAILDGDPGLGKSLVTLDWAARVTRGLPFPDQSPGTAADVLIVNCEDGVADTIRPRLEALGANLDRVHLFHGPNIEGHEFLPSLPRDLFRLEKAIERCQAALVVIDPIMVFLDDTVVSSNDQSVRQALSPLSNVAERTSAAVVLVRHLNKTGGAKAVYRGGGSIGIIGACRSAWLIARHPSDEHQRVLAQIKNNLAKPQPSLSYELVSDEHDQPQVAWLGIVEIAADELVGAAAAVADLPALERAVGLLREALANGPRPVAELIAELSKQHVSRATLFRAKKEAGVESLLEKNATGCRALWRLADAPPADRKGDDDTAAYLRGLLDESGPYGQRT